MRYLWFEERDYRKRPGTRLHDKARGDFGRYRLRFDFRRIGGVARRPDASLLALDRERAVHQELMLDVETRTAELAHPGRQLDDVAEPRRSQKARAGIDQGYAHDAVGRAELVRLHAKRRLKKGPRAPIEEFEEPAVEDDAGWVAMAPFDHELPSVDETGHRVVGAGLFKAAGSKPGCKLDVKRRMSNARLKRDWR